MFVYWFIATTEQPDLLHVFSLQLNYPCQFLILNFLTVLGRRLKPST